MINSITLSYLSVWQVLRGASKWLIKCFFPTSQTSSVQLHLWGEYRWKDKMDDFAEPETRYDHVRYTLSPPPLYGKVCALYSPQHMPLSPFGGQHHPNSPFVGQHRPVSPFAPGQHRPKSPFANEHGF